MPRAAPHVSDRVGRGPGVRDGWEVGRDAKASWERDGDGEVERGEEGELSEEGADVGARREWCRRRRRGSGGRR